MAKKGRQTSEAKSQALESGSGGSSDGGDSDSGTGYESTIGEDATVDNDDYEVDAILYAVYRDSRADRPDDGWLGWHYKVMWAGERYLKTGHESEEGLENFNPEGKELHQFWKSSQKGIPKGEREPKGEIGERYDAPPYLLKQWFSNSKPQRDYQAYKRRQKYDYVRRNKYGVPVKVPVKKKDSDHYINLARQQRASEKVKRKLRTTATKSPAATKRAARQSTNDVAGSNPRRKSARPAKTSSTDVLMDVVHQIASSSPSTSSTRLTSPLTPHKPSSAGPSTRWRPIGRVPSLSDFDSDHEVDAVLGAEPERESATPEAIEVPLAATQASRKRKREGSPAGTGGAPSSRGQSALSRSGPGRSEGFDGKRGNKEKGGSGGGGTRKKGNVQDKGKGRRMAETDEEEDDEDHRPIARPTKSTRTKSEVLSSMKFTKRPVPAVDLTNAPSSTHSSVPSETFGSPHTGIFQLEEAEEGDRTGAPEQNDDLFAMYDDNDDLVLRPAVDPPISASTAPRPSSSRNETVSLVSASGKATSAVAASRTGKADIAAGAASLPSRPSFASHRAKEASRPQPLVASAQAATAGAGPFGIPAPSGSGLHAPRKKYEQGVKIKRSEDLAAPGPDQPRKGGRWGRGMPVPTLPAKGETQMPLAVRAFGSLQPASAPLSAASPGSGYGAASLPSPPRGSTQPSATHPSHSPDSGHSRSARAATGPRVGSSSSAVPPYSNPPTSTPIAPATLPSPPEADVGAQDEPHSSSLQPHTAASDPRPTHGDSQNLQFSPSPEPEPEPEPHHSASSTTVPPLAKSYHAYPSPSSPSHQQAALSPADDFPSPPHLPTTPLSQSPTVLPGQLDSGDAIYVQEHETIGTCRISASVPPHHTALSCNIRLLRGTPALSFDDISLQGIVGRSRSAHMYFETLDAFCLVNQIAHHGSEVLEWAKVISSDEEQKEDYDEVAGLAAAADSKVFATYFESPSTRVDRHYALVLASARVIDFDAWRLHRGGWQVSEMGFVAVLVALPLDWPPLQVPHPVDPRLHFLSSPPPSITTGPLPLLASYDLTKHISAARGKVVEYPPQLCDEQPSDLSLAVRKGFRSAGAISKDDRVDIYVVENGRLGTADTYVVENARLGTAMIPIEPTGIIPPQTAILAFGPSLSLLPSQWKAKTRWREGGLITFSPSFMLRYPEKFADIIRLMRPLRHFAAYIIPPALEWAHDSWENPIRCPDAAKAFDHLTRALSLDQDISTLSGAAVESERGGLAISICPPSSLQPVQCATWIDWYIRVCGERDYGTLLQQCRGVRPRQFDTLPSRNQSADTAVAQSLHIRDVERSQLADMVDMRMRPDVSYRRYLFVGETTLDNETKEGFIKRGIEFVHSDAIKGIFGESSLRR